MKSFKKLFAVCACVLVVACMMIPFASAASDASVASEAVSAAKSVFDDVTGSVLNVSNVLSVLGIVLVAAFGLWFFWWGLRKVIGIIQRSFKGGNTRV